MYGDYVHSVEVKKSLVQRLQLLEFAHFIQRKDLVDHLVAEMLGPGR